MQKAELQLPLQSICMLLQWSPGCKMASVTSGQLQHATGIQVTLLIQLQLIQTEAEFWFKAGFALVNLQLCAPL